MNQSEIKIIADQLAETWQGDPWYGKPVQQLLSGISGSEAYTQPGGQHSVAQLVWHMVNWRQFVLSRIHPEASPELEYFEENDWRQASATSEFTLEAGLKQLEQAQKDLLEAFAQLDDSILDRQVEGRNYNFRKLFYGIIQHDIYHLGQVAYVVKLQRGTQ